MKNWNNIDIELLDHETEGDLESVMVRVARSPAGVQREPIKVSIPKSLRNAQQQLGDDALSLEQTVELGKQLSDVLLPGEASELFENSRAALPADVGLRIRIELRALALADLPWEFIYRQANDYDGSALERGFLALDRALSIVRYEPVAQAPMSCEPLRGKPVKISLLLANPDIPNYAKLDLAREIKAVESALGDEPDVELSVLENATQQSLNDSLDDRPHVFHFAGHGRFKVRPSDEFGVYVGTGELLLEDEQGELQVMAAPELATKMRGSGVRLAVLNSCESARRDNLNAFTGVAPTLVRDGVPAVVAMQYNIRDEHALQFSRRFYRNLARNKSIDDAINAARIAMFNLGVHYTRDWGLPVLYLRSDEAVLFPDKTRSKSALGKLGLTGIINIALATLLVIAVSLFYAFYIEPRIPLGSVVWGVLAAAGLAGIGFLRYIAGDSLRAALLNWLRRKFATAVLGSAVVVSSAGFYIMPELAIARIIPGKTLMSLLAASDLDGTPMRVYSLRVRAGGDQAGANEVAGNLALSQDFRKSGVLLAASNSLVTQLSKRYAESITGSIEAYLSKEGLDDHKESFIALWQKQPQSLVLKGLGKAKRLMVELAHQGVPVACQTVTLKNSVTVITLEKNDEC